MLGPHEFRARLKRALADELDDAEVSAERGKALNLLGSVVSPRFEGMDEGDRQQIVWMAILDEFSPAEQEWIEFVYTDATSELTPESTS